MRSIVLFVSSGKAYLRHYRDYEMVRGMPEKLLKPFLLVGLSKGKLSFGTLRSAFGKKINEH